MSFTKNKDTSPLSSSERSTIPSTKRYTHRLKAAVVLYDTDRVPPRLMLLTGDALDQSPDRPLAIEPLERRRTPQKLREDYQELPDALHEMRIKVFVCPPRILSRRQLFGHAGPYLVRDPCNVSHVLRYKTARGSSLA